MKRIYVLGLVPHSDNILRELRLSGVVHVEYINTPEGSSLDLLGNDIQKASEALALLSKETDPTHCSEDGMSIVNKLAELGEKRRGLNEELIQLRREAAKVSHLGDYNPEDIKYLETKNIRLRLYRIKEKQLPEVPDDLVYSIVSRLKDTIIIAVVFLGEPKEIPFIEEPLPPRSVESVRNRIKEVELELDNINKEIGDYGGYRNKVNEVMDELNARRDMEKTMLGMGKEGEIIFLKGFCPEPDVEKLKEVAKENSFGLMINDPDADVEPPTLLKNPEWINLIKPVFAIINTLPGYREFDISMWFLLFFSVFFALLIGDAGYGAIILGGTALCHYKLGKKIPTREPFYLMYILSLCTLIWGAVTGNWLGIEAITEMTPFKYLIFPPVNAYSDISQTTMMNLCFIIGAVQLSIGHLLVLFRYINNLHALAQLGWIAIIWSVFFLARNLVLGFSIPPFFYHLLIFGGILVFLFTAPQKNILKGILMGFADFPMSVINTFADNMSYIRLFAVGMATLAVAQSFNNIGMDVGFGNIFKGFLTAIILVFGHTLNIILAAMAVIVHGVRLNMLEFSGHVGNTWSGYEYKPFKNK